MLAVTQGVRGDGEVRLQTASATMVEQVPGVGRVRRRQRNWLPALMIAPAILFVLGISAYPIADAIDLSLYRTEFANKVGFIGLANYTRLLADPTIWADAGRSAVYALGSLLVVLPYSMGLALLLEQDVPFRGLFRTLAIVPWIFSQTITALLWGWLLNPDFGMAAYIVQSLSGLHLQALATPWGAMGTVIFANVWASYPMATLLFMAALQTIPGELYEAADVDGATGWKRFWFVTEPLLRPTVLVVVIQLTLQYLNMVTLLYVLTGGGPLGGTETLALRVLKTSFENWDLGAGSALGVLITTANIFLSLIYIRALKERS